MHRFHTEQALKKKFKRQINNMNKLMKEVREIHPVATLYLANGTMNLMTGHSHDGPGVPRQDRVLCSEDLDHSSGGDW